jgi:FkbM family methyltransferase
MPEFVTSTAQEGSDQEILEEQDWPSEALQFARGLTKSADSNRNTCILDVGAHRGESFRHFSGLISGDLNYFGFEPNPESFGMLTQLEEKVKDTRRSVSFFPFAVGAASESVEFRVTNSSEVSGVLVPEPELLERVPSGDHELKRIIEVDQISIDDFIQKNNLRVVDILKIDTEGYDLEVIRGARNSLRRGLIEIVICEVFFVKYRQNQAYFWDLATEFENLGFSFVNLFDARNTTQGRLYTANAIWTSPRLSVELGYL